MEKSKLIELALEARLASYSPHSGFKVGAALLAKDGRVFTGCNIESAAYSPSNCAERTALFKAVSEGVHEFSAIAVVGAVSECDPQNMDDYAAPCGVCRQMLYEFSKDGSLEIIMAKSKDDYKTLSLRDILPLAFVGW